MQPFRFLVLLLVVALVGCEGTPGEQGLPGQEGAPGENGAPGVDGMNADPQAIADALLDSVSFRQQIVEALRNDPTLLEDFRGEQGPPGEAGPQGEQGETGPRGEPGLPGDASPEDIARSLAEDDEFRQALITVLVEDHSEELRGAQGELGPVGLQGAEGPQGEPGPTGEDGSSCSVNDNQNGTATIECDDGTSAQIQGGTQGPLRVYQGTYTVTNQLDADLLSLYSEITGDLWFESNYVPINIPSIERVGGNIRVERGALFETESFKMPGLTSVTGGIIIESVYLTEVDLGSLESVGGVLRLRNLNATQFNLESLTSVGSAELNLGAVGHLDLSNLIEVRGALTVNSRADSLDLSGLVDMPSDLYVSGAPTELDLSELVNVDGNFTYGTNEESVLLPSLITVGGRLQLSGSPTATDIELPALEFVDGDLWVRNNAVLTNFDFPALQRVGANLWFDNNQSLATCLIDALVEQLEGRQGIGGSLTDGENNDRCTCQVIDDRIEVTCR